MAMTVVKQGERAAGAMCREKQIEMAIAIEVHEVQPAQPPLGMALVVLRDRGAHTAHFSHINECLGQRIGRSDWDLRVVSPCWRRSQHERYAERNPPKIARLCPYEC